MSKLDKIGYYDKETGEELSYDMFKNINKEEKTNLIKSLYFKLEKEPNNLTVNDLVILMKLENRPTSPNTIKLDFGEDGYFTCKRDINLVLELHDYTKSFLYSISHMITHDGRLKYGNNKIIPSLNKLKEYLNISDGKWNRNIKIDIEKFNIIVKEKIDNTWCLLLNPIFATSNNFILRQFHIDLFGERLVYFFYNKITDLKLLEKYKHLITEIEYQNMEFCLNPDKYYKVYNEAIDLSGIYLLYNNNEVVYIGKSKNIKNRITQHKSVKEFDSVKCVIFKDIGMINLYEPYLIQRYKPIYNKDLLEKTVLELPEINIDK